MSRVSSVVGLVRAMSFWVLVTNGYLAPNFSLEASIRFFGAAAGGVDVGPLLKKYDANEGGLSVKIGRAF